MPGGFSSPQQYLAGGFRFLPCPFWGFGAEVSTRAPVSASIMSTSPPWPPSVGAAAAAAVAVVGWVREALW